MRVIGGEFRSRKLKSIVGSDVRPTPDRLRETLFNIIAADVPGAVFLDAYAGTGAVGIEALSRGAARAIFLEKNRQAAEVIDQNLRALGAAGRARVIIGAARVHMLFYLKSPTRVQIVFLDPPYDAPAEYDDTLDALGRSECPLVIAQHDRRTALNPDYGALRKVREIRQGDNVLSFYRSGPPAEP